MSYGRGSVWKETPANARGRRNRLPHHYFCEAAMA